MAPSGASYGDGHITRVSMRACARVALASIAVSASFSLSGCAAIEELKETFLRWVESQKLLLATRRRRRALGEAVLRLLISIREPLRCDLATGIRARLLSALREREVVKANVQPFKVQPVDGVLHDLQPIARRIDRDDIPRQARLCEQSPPR